MNIIQLVKDLDSANADLASLEKNYKSSREEITTLINKIKGDISISKSGVDVDQITAGLQVIDIRGKDANSEQRKDAVSRALSDLSSGLAKLRYRYMGVKNYSGFGDQDCDCEYGMGPRHGSIVFMVGLKINRLEDNFTDEELNAAAYTLLNIDKVLDSRRQ